MPILGSYVKGSDIADGPYVTHLCDIPTAIIPQLVGGLELRANLFNYEPDSAFDAVQLIREAQVSIITGSSDVKRLYRMLDRSLFGTEYTADIEGVITPEIADIHTNPVMPLSVNDAAAKLVDTRNILANAINGEIIGTEYTDTQTIRQTLLEIRDGLATDDADIEDILANLELVLALLA